MNSTEFTDKSQGIKYILYTVIYTTASWKNKLESFQDIHHNNVKGMALWLWWGMILDMKQGLGLIIYSQLYFFSIEDKGTVSGTK